MSAAFTLLHSDPEHQVPHQKYIESPLALVVILCASADFCPSQHIIKILYSCLSVKATVNVKHSRL